MDKRFARLLAVSICATALAIAQPVIGGSAVNSASYRTPGMPGSGVAQGSIFIVFGTGLGPASLVEATAFPLQTTLGGTSVSVTVGGATQSAFIVYTYNYGVAAILPSTTPLGSGSITVTYNGQTSAPAPIQVVASAFGVFTVNSAGYGQAIATDLSYHQHHHPHVSSGRLWHLVGHRPGGHYRQRCGTASYRQRGDRHGLCGKHAAAVVTLPRASRALRGSIRSTSRFRRE